MSGDRVQLGEARDAFDAHFEALQGRQYPSTRGQMQKLRSLYDAAVREHEEQKLSLFNRPLKSWEWFEARLASEDAAPVEQRYPKPGAHPRKLFAQFEVYLDERAPYRKPGVRMPRHLSYTRIGARDRTGLDRKQVVRVEEARDRALEAGLNLVELMEIEDFDAGNGMRFFPTKKLVDEALKTGRKPD